MLSTKSVEFERIPNGIQRLENGIPPRRLKCWEITPKNGIRVSHFLYVPLPAFHCGLSCIARVRLSKSVEGCRRVS
jgi:hypothetical protein